MILGLFIIHFQVRFHPSIPDRLISSSTDGLVCLFDIGEASEDDALIQTFNADVAVVCSVLFQKMD